MEFEERHSGRAHRWVNMSFSMELQVLLAERRRPKHKEHEEQGGQDWR